MSPRGVSVFTCCTEPAISACVAKEHDFGEYFPLQMAAFIHNQSSSAPILRKFSGRETPRYRISKGRSKPLPPFVFGELCYYYLPDHEYTGSSGYSQKQGHRDWLLIKGNRKRKALSVREWVLVREDSRGW